MKYSGKKLFAILNLSRQILSKTISEKTKKQITNSDECLKSPKSFWMGTVVTFLPSLKIRALRAWATSILLFLAAELIPVVRMDTSIFPEVGSVADCLRASRYSLNASSTSSFFTVSENLGNERIQMRACSPCYKEPGLGRGLQKGPENTRKFSGGPGNDRKTRSKKQCNEIGRLLDLLCGNEQKTWSSDFETYILNKQKTPENSMLQHPIFWSFLPLQIRLLERLLWLLLKANFCLNSTALSPIWHTMTWINMYP